MSFPASFRSLARARALSITVVLTVAIGVATLTTTFGVVNAALFRQPPFYQADRIALLYLQRNPRGEAPYQERWSFARSELLRTQQNSFEHVATYSPATVTLAGSADPELVQGERVSASYFGLLRARTSRGRLFTEFEDAPANPTPVVVIGHGLWQRRWGGDSSIIGTTIRLNGVPLTIIGIMDDAFRGLSGKSELWIPRTMSPQVTYPEYLTTNQNFISAVARLRDGVTLDAARAELAVLGAGINRAIPSDPEYPEERVTATARTLNDARTNPTVRRSLFVLLGAVTLLHLLACSNVTNLLLGRAATRRRESAVRVALGSSTTRLFRHIASEGVVLGGIGTTLGIAGAWWASSFVTPPNNVWAPRNFYGSLAPFDAPAFGGQELLFGIALATVTTLLVALPPAMTAFRVDAASGVKAAARGISGGMISLRRPTARGIIIGIETALAMMLVVTGGLLIESFQRMRRVDIGVEPSNVLTFWVMPSEARVPPAAAPAFVSRVLEAISRVPGVQSASVDGGAPLAGTASSVLYIEGRPEPAPGEAPDILRHYIGPDHFTTMGIPVRRGRVFTASDDATAPLVTVISETAARRFWPNEDPIGRRVWFGSGTVSSAQTSAEIIGVVADVVYAPLDQRPNFASFYTPYPQFTYGMRMVFVRTTGEPMAMVPQMRKAIASVDPELGLREVQPLSEIVSGSWMRHRFDAFMFGFFGVAALLLAASGIFAVLSYAVASRRREFGVRLALGASTKTVLAHVLREGLSFPVAGLIVGAGAAFAVTRVLQSSLYDISAHDPVVFAATAVMLVAVAAVACLIPAWRATRADPMEAIRAD